MCLCVTCPIACVHGVLQQSPPTMVLALSDTLPKYAMSHRRVGKVNKFAVPETVVFFFHKYIYISFTGFPANLSKII